MTVQIPRTRPQLKLVGGPSFVIADNDPTRTMAPAG